MTLQITNNGLLVLVADSHAILSLPFRILTSLVYSCFFSPFLSSLTVLNTDLVYKRVVLDESAIKVLEYNAYILHIKSIRAWKTMSSSTQYIFSDDLTKYGIHFSFPIRKVINISAGRTAVLHMENNILYITFSESVAEGENIYIDETFPIS